MLGTFLERVQLASDRVRVTLSLPLLAAPTAIEPARLLMTYTVPVQMKRRGAELKLVIQSEAQAPSAPDPAMLKALVRARRWFRELAAGEVASITAIACREQVSDGYVKRLLPLAFLAPDIVKSICRGTQPLGLTAELLTRATPLPLDWHSQREMLDCRGR